MPSKTELIDALKAKVAAIETSVESSENLLAVATSCSCPDDSLDASEAYKKILRLAAVRERSSSELKKRLKKENFSEDEIECALRRASSLGIVNDERFALALVRARYAAGRGRCGIEAELARHDISPLSDEVWREVNADDLSEFSRAFAVLNAKPPQSKNKRDGAFRKLLQKGYAVDVAATAARKWSESSL